MPTIREVADKAGVSPTTVSHIVNNTRFVSDEIRQRVQAAMDELGYRPNTLARSLRRGETHTIGLILPDSSNPYFAEVGHTIEATAFGLGYSVVLCNSESNPEKEAFYADLLSKRQVDGMIFFAVGDQSRSLQGLLRQSVPVVVVDRDLAEIEVDAVLADNLAGGYLATHHLLEQGHRRIGLIAGPSNVTPSADREIGYRQALDELGLELEPALCDRGDFHYQSGQDATRRLLGLAHPPSAIFACNDVMAVGAIRAASEAGVRVPHDLAIVGFDDIELASYTVPALTTVAQPKEEMGRQAVRTLVTRMRNKEEPIKRIVLPTELIVRGSSLQ